MTRFANYSRVYGSLGAGIALLVWLYIIALSVLSGAEFNAQIHTDGYSFPGYGAAFDRHPPPPDTALRPQESTASPAPECDSAGRMGAAAANGPSTAAAQDSDRKDDPTRMSAPPIAPGSSAAEVLRRAKIVATLGPSCSTEEVFRKLVDAGLDVVRLNFSHGSHEQKADLIRMVRKVAIDVGRPLCILADLQGPKIRTAKLKDHKPVMLEAGKHITIIAA